MRMSFAVQHLMWFEHLFQMQGHLLLSWTEWIALVCLLLSMMHKKLVFAFEFVQSLQNKIGYVFVLT